MIDSMPTGGRNAAKLAEISRRSSVHIVCPTGLHLRKYYPEGHWGNRLSRGTGRIFIGEIIEGIDANDLSGPVLKRLPQLAPWSRRDTPPASRPDQNRQRLDRIDDRERRIFEAAAIAHRLTGCPILTHTEQGTAALEQIELLRAMVLASLTSHFPTLTASPTRLITATFRKAACASSSTARFAGRKAIQRSICSSRSPRIFPTN